MLIGCVSFCFAETTEEIEEYFQQGLQLGQSGMLDAAIQEFKKVVSVDPANLDFTYYFQTYSESYYNIGLLYAKKEQWEDSIVAYEKALKIHPQHKRALYYLSFSYMASGEIAKALDYYDKAKASGFLEGAAGADFVGEHLKNYTKREFDIEYKPLLNDEDDKITIRIKGNPIGDNELIKDTITGLEKQELINRRSLFIFAEVEFIRFKENGTIAVEKWSVTGKEGLKEYWVSSDSTPPEGFPFKIMVKVSEHEL